MKDILTVLLTLFPVGLIGAIICFQITMSQIDSNPLLKESKWANRLLKGFGWLGCLIFTIIFGICLLICF